MRKFVVLELRGSKRYRLQCGRIYKDAEMRYVHVRETNHGDFLQCGRIYKDAEINSVGDHDWYFTDLQCGRIYKDAEIRSIRWHRGTPIALQCGRIYKDAEIPEKTEKKKAKK